MYTGVTRNAQDVAKSYINKIKNVKSSNIMNILNFVNEGENLLKKGNLSDFGKLLNESWNEKKGNRSYKKHPSNKQ